MFQEYSTKILVKEYKSIYFMNHVIRNVSLRELRKKREIIQELKKRNYDINSLYEWGEQIKIDCNREDYMLAEKKPK